MKTLSLLFLAVFIGTFSFSSISHADEIKTFTAITRGTTKPFSYFDENDKLTGFDVELLRLIEAKNPSLHVEFQTMSVSAGYLALDGGQADLIANQMTKNPRNRDKYFFPEEPNNYISSRLVVRSDDTTVKSVNDLAKKRVIMVAPSEFARFIDAFDKEGKLGIKKMYTDKGNEEIYNAIATGRADVGATYEYVFNVAKKQSGFNLKLVGPSFLGQPTYFTIRKSPENEELLKKITATLKQFRADGTLKALSVKFFGADYTAPQ